MKKIRSVGTPVLIGMILLTTFSVPLALAYRYISTPFSGSVYYDTDEFDMGCQWFSYTVSISSVSPSGNSVYVVVKEWVDPENPPSYMITRWSGYLGAGQNTGLLYPERGNSIVYVHVSNPSHQQNLSYWGACEGISTRELLIETKTFFYYTSFWSIFF